jgi:hypothetical protein
MKAVKMKLTQYGYAGDPYKDSQTEAGHGAYHDLEKGVSCALTDSAKTAIGATKRCWVRISFASGGSIVRRYDDRAPESDHRCDLYQKGGFDHGLPDYATIEVTSSPVFTSTR